jgi:hypothetical protein
MSLDAVRARVRQLAAAGKLDKRLHRPADRRLPWSEWLWVDGAFALVAGAIAIARAGLRVAETKQPVAAADVVHAAALLALSGVCFGLARLVPAAEHRRRRLLRKGLVVPAAVVQANALWYRAANDEWQPGTVVWSADPVATAATLEDVAGDLGALKARDRRAMPPEQGRLAWDLYHEMGPGPALPVPRELAHGLRDVWMGSAMLPPGAASEDLFALVLPGAANADGSLVLTRTQLED